MVFFSHSSNRRLLFVIVLGMLIAMPLFQIQAGSFSDGFTDTEIIRQQSGVRQFGSLGDIIIAVLVIGLSIMATVALVVLLYGGFTYMTSLGEEDKARRAKQIILYALIGLAVVMASGALVNFIIVSFVAR